MHTSEISRFYEQYIDCLNSRTLEDLGHFVNARLTYNQKAITLKDYQEMLAQNFEDIPDLYFEIDLLVAGEAHIASRLNFNCTPVGEFMGISVNGRKVSFSEHVFYKLTHDKIGDVWSLIDKDAIRAQIAE
jgi:predicted ester cyclase